MYTINAYIHTYIYISLARDVRYVCVYVCTHISLIVDQFVTREEKKKKVTGSICLNRFTVASIDILTIAREKRRLFTEIIVTIHVRTSYKTLVKHSST